MSPTRSIEENIHDASRAFHGDRRRTDRELFADAPRSIRNSAIKKWYQKSKSVSAKAVEVTSTTASKAYAACRNIFAEKDVLEDFSGCRRTQRIAVLGVLHKSGIGVDGGAADRNAEAAQKAPPAAGAAHHGPRTIRGLIAMAARCLHRQFGIRRALGQIAQGHGHGRRRRRARVCHRGRRRHLCRRRLARLRQRDHFAPRSQDQLALRPQQRTQR